MLRNTIISKRTNSAIWPIPNTEFIHYREKIYVKTGIIRSITFSEDNLTRTVVIDFRGLEEYQTYVNDPYIKIMHDEIRENNDAVGISVEIYLDDIPDE
jgi:hypothetical protein